jgi:hypothetical protein
LCSSALLVSGVMKAANTTDSLRVGTTVQTPGTGLGSPIKITWSIVPDGTNLPATFTDPATNPNPKSSLIASLDNR